MAKVKQEQQSFSSYWEEILQYFRSDAGKKLGECLLWLGAGFCLAGGRILTAPLPSCVCLMAALGAGLPGLWVLLGTLLGGLFLATEAGLLLNVAGGFLAWMLHWALRDFSFFRHRLFVPLSALAVGTLVGGLLFLSGPKDPGTVLLFLLQLALLPLGAAAFRQVLEKKPGPGVNFLYFAAISGLSRLILPGGVPLGAVGAGALLLLLPGEEVLLPAFVAGLSLEFSWQPGFSCLGILAAVTVAASLVPGHRLWRELAFLLGGAASALLLGGDGGLLILAMGLGGLCALLLPEKLIPGLANDREEYLQAADVLEGVYRELTRPAPVGFSESFRKDLYFLQQKSRQRELRSILAIQYRVLADFLRRTGRKQTPVQARWEAEWAFRQEKKRGNSVCGDRVASLSRGNFFYLLLCDGMGTGPDAREDSRRAGELLEGLLAAGMAADDALETLNITTILKEGGGECALDLLEIDLSSAEAVLYKWGGAPSYLVTGTEVKKMGTASLPPGVGVGGTHQAQRIRLSLGRGEALILTSDGIGGEVAEYLLQRHGDVSSENLAAGALGAGCSRGEDDATAVVLKLRSVSAP